MENKKVYELTEEGKKKLEEELEDLKVNKIPENIRAIADARSQGDLSENADYTAAREAQARLNARLVEIENILKNVKIIKIDDTDLIQTGKTVNLEFKGKNVTYKIVGTIEANPFEGKISNESPMGKAIIGHKKGQTVTVVPENGNEFKVKILDVKKSE